MGYRRLWLAAVTVAIPALLQTGGAAASCDVPASGVLRTDGRLPHHPLVNFVTLSSDDEARWNGVPISLATLEDYMRNAAAIDPEPFTVFAHSSANCAGVEAIRKLLSSARLCTLGLCGEGYRWFRDDGELFTRPRDRPVSSRAVP